MVKRGGTEAEAKRLAGEFQELIVDVLLARRADQGRERHHRGQGAAHDQAARAGEQTERVQDQRRLLSRDARSS